MSKEDKVVPLDNRPWKDRLLRSGDKPIPNLFNCVTALRYCPQWQGVLVHNTLSHKVSTAKPTPWGQSYATWSDIADGLTAAWMQEEGINVHTGIASEAVRIVAHDHEFSPLFDYLNSLEWDGWHRVNTWTFDYLGVSDTAYSRAVGKAWLISAVARAYQPGCKADYAIILEGPQGRGKSSALKALASPAWFADYISENLSSKDACILCSGVWIIEFSELEGIMHQHARVEAAKAFITRTEDRYRPPYGQNTIDVPRQCVFAATTNRDSYMLDETGNRRFWPIKCGSIYPGRIERDRDQIWAEAVRLYLEGETAWLSEDLEAEAKHEQKLRYEADPWEEAIGKWLEKRKDASTTEILEECLRKDPGTWARYDQMRVARCLKSLGWEKYRVPGQGHNRYRLTR